VTKICFHLETVYYPAAFIGGLSMLLVLAFSYCRY